MKELCTGIEGSGFFEISNFILPCLLENARVHEKILLKHNVPQAHAAQLFLV